MGSAEYVSFPQRSARSKQVQRQILNAHRIEERAKVGKIGSDIADLKRIEGVQSPGRTRAIS